MSLNIKISKYISIVSFLMIMGLYENAVPNFALLAIYLFQFFNDVLGNSLEIFWEGLMVIPILSLLVVFLTSKSYRILLFSIIGLLISLIYTTGIIHNYDRINFWFVLILVVYIVSSINVLVVIRNKNKC